MKSLYGGGVCNSVKSPTVILGFLTTEAKYTCGRRQVWGTPVKSGIPSGTSRLDGEVVGSVVGIGLTRPLPSIGPSDGGSPKGFG